MQSTERQKFEENWKSAFEGAEMTPSDQVWNSIELDLAGQESVAMKKRVVFYQRLAAATVLFALLMGTYAFYTNYNNTEKQIAKNSIKSDVKGEVKSNEKNNVKSDVKSESADQTIDNKTNNTPPNSTKTTETTGTPTKDNPSNQVGITKEKKPVEKEPVVAQTFVPQIVSAEDRKEQKEVVVVRDESVTAEVVKDQPVKEKPSKQDPNKAVNSPILQTAPLVASLEPEEEVEKTEKKKNRGESTWLSLGAAAGNYTPNSVSAASPGAGFSSVSNSPTYASLDAASNSSNKTKVGTAYSVGMAVGKKFGRFVVQSGVNLNKQQIDYTSSYDSRSQATNTAKASMSDYNMAEASSLTPTAAYTVNSSMEIISIPVQAGYMIVDRKLGWQLNAGVSSDFFLRNTLVDKSGQRERFTQSAGEASPYRSVNWSGLFNTELSYKIGEHYRLSLVPGVRYSFNPLLKDATADSGRPLILDVGFRFKYLFD